MTTGPDNPFAALDGFELRNLAAHLEAAGQPAVLHRVLGAATKAGRNAWYEARLALDDPDGYADDVQRAWRLAEAGGAAEGAASPDLELRYSLITATVSTRTGFLPAELVAAALEHGLWSPRRAVAYANQLRDPLARARLLAALVPHLPGPTRQDALRDMIGALSAGVTLSRTVFAHLPAELPGPVAEQALALARSLADAPDRVAALRDVALRQPEPSRPPVLREALDVALDIPAAESKLDVLSALIPSLPGPLRAQAAPAVLAAARDSGPASAGSRVRSLLGLVSSQPS